MDTEVVRIKTKYQIVIPVALRKKLSFKIGDLLEARVKGDEVLLKPVKTISKDQAWFWTERWQKMEKEAQEDIDAGRVEEFNNIDDLIKALKK
ncbi:hypothetical protein COY52_11450 [Candidatus Desantisbacteria bacterium CG_4_10_14_0_8_um_filter_48_22]|uniref:SpoVT-AbrB domain-containing protein n=1 Tax=Candidatus Desantisbacteria bacterium CG_4_10_14_0_8_um_filter_48_22 TaxID=1974543 RepID=A0A2M7S552_9BACT|nr:MAG: hypothetical protein AUJ67_06915 [Candidatus Desantisbacteria bacterium CG1_02_49_89]PIV56569.1 MAG: hypothetical protein COS16_03515 [Candidatus Desantisbacteria bacterium CG02_land_8_20_14_3_00_49_13]PIZ14690.1 MAG: hypothetical protein COY52_11450 [Candidatus Desantisbacteria bacterium CG_4_10_14_0_8_um_filter_48_22]